MGSRFCLGNGKSCCNFASIGPADAEPLCFELLEAVDPIAEFLGLLAGNAEFARAGRKGFRGAADAEAPPSESMRYGSAFDSDQDCFPALNVGC